MLGVANANQKPCQVLIEEGTDCVDYSMIHGDQFFLPFKRKSADSFRESVKEAIRKFVMGKTQQQMEAVGYAARKLDQYAARKVSHLQSGYCTLINGR